jgi:hypothetical protein
MRKQQKAIPFVVALALLVVVAATTGCPRRMKTVNHRVYEAVALLEIKVAENPSNAFTHLQLSAAYARLLTTAAERWEVSPDAIRKKARAHAEIALTLEPDDAALNVSAARVLNDIGDSNRVEEIIKVWLPRLKSNPDLFLPAMRTNVVLSLQMQAQVRDDQKQVIDWMENWQKKRKPAASAP